MRATVKYLRSLELEESLADYSPEDVRNFGTWIRAEIGPQDEEGAEFFDILLCTPEWLKAECLRRQFIWGRPLLVVDHYNYEEVTSFIAKTVRNLSGKDWDELATKISRIANWEFDDYVPYQG